MKSSKIQTVKHTYNLIGSEFSASRQYIWPDIKPFLENIEANSSVLDVGCGNGRLLLGLPKNIKYTGVDNSRVLLKEARKTNPYRKFIETDITKKVSWKILPQYDYIFSLAVIHHLPTEKDQLFVLKKIKEHLKPNGKILISVWNLWQPKYLKYHLDLKTKLQNRHFVYIPFQGTPRFCFAFTKPYLKRLLRKSKLNLKIKNTGKNYLLY